MDEFAADESKTAQGFAELDASSLAVGLPKGLMGNSEVGHLNIGAGRVVWQDVVRIDQALERANSTKWTRSRHRSSTPKTAMAACTC